MFSNMGILGLEMPIPPPQPPAAPPSQPPQNPNHHPQMGIPYTHNHHYPDPQTQLTMKQPYPAYNEPHKPKPQQQGLTHSDDDDQPGCANFNDELSNGSDAKRKISKVSPWQRMKWTDNMVRLLIMAVYYIGDEAGFESNSEKKKKGKWKSVSRAMMEKGFYVSPQQCEDKFNDLNKRYKRVNDILGKGTACKVVENQSLLESMDLTPKMKEEVKKLLNSKHLFFREMCAYHNSCGHSGGGSGVGGGGGGVVAHHASGVQQQCQHSSGSAAVGGVIAEEEEDDIDDEDDDDDDDHADDEDDHDDDDDGVGPRKRARGEGSRRTHEMNEELIGFLRDKSKSLTEKKQYVMTQMMKLQEIGVKYQYQALELEKQRLKWNKYSSKKEREMETRKLENERRRLENERLMLILRQKEIELFNLQHHHQQQQYPPNPSSVTG